MHTYVQSFLLVYTTNSPGSDQQYQSHLCCFFYSPTNLKICLKLAVYMSHNQSICVTGGWASSQLLGQKTNLQSVQSKTSKRCHSTPNPTKETQDYWNMLVSTSVPFVLSKRETDGH